MENVIKADPIVIMKMEQQLKEQAELLKKLESVKSIEIQAKRWFQKSFGNTYFSADIYVNDSLVKRFDFEYGYNDHCIDVACEWLKENGFLPNIENAFFWRLTQNTDIKTLTNIIDVKRKKDL